jgi:hypothetical protein
VLFQRYWIGLWSRQVDFNCWRRLRRLRCRGKRQLSGRTSSLGVRWFPSCFRVNRFSSMGTTLDVGPFSSEHVQTAVWMCFHICTGIDTSLWVRRASLDRCLKGHRPFILAPRTWSNQARGAARQSQQLSVTRLSVCLKPTRGEDPLVHCIDALKKVPYLNSLHD